MPTTPSQPSLAGIGLIQSTESLGTNPTPYTHLFTHSSLEGVKTALKHVVTDLVVPIAFQMLCFWFPSPVAQAAVAVGKVLIGGLLG